MCLSLWALSLAAWSGMMSLEQDCRAENSSSSPHTWVSKQVGHAPSQGFTHFDGLVYACVQHRLGPCLGPLGSIGGIMDGRMAGWLDLGQA